MNKSQLEQYIAAFLFLAVLVAFSYAEKESRKIQELYKVGSAQIDSPKVKKMALLPFTPKGY